MGMPKRISYDSLKQGEGVYQYISLEGIPALDYLVTNVDLSFHIGRMINKSFVRGINKRLFGAEHPDHPINMTADRLLILDSMYHGMEIPKDLENEIFNNDNLATPLTDAQREQIYNISRAFDAAQGLDPEGIKPNTRSDDRGSLLTTKIRTHFDAIEIGPGKPFYDLVTDPSNSPGNIARLLVDFSERYKADDQKISVELESSKELLMSACEKFPQFKERFMEIGNQIEAIEEKEKVLV